MRLTKTSEHQSVDHLTLRFECLSSHDILCQRNRITKEWLVGDTQHHSILKVTLIDLERNYKIAQQKWIEEEAL